MVNKSLIDFIIEIESFYHFVIVDMNEQFKTQLEYPLSTLWILPVRNPTNGSENRGCLNMDTEVEFYILGVFHKTTTNGEVLKTYIFINS